jgi:ATP-dependent Clp protease protease subunit
MNNSLNDFRKFAIDKANVSPSVVDDVIKKTENSIMPFILEERKMNVTQMDVFSRLLFDRIIYFSGVVDSESCNTVIAQLLYLSSTDNRDINLYINSPGGSVIDGLGVIDTINFIPCDVTTTCVGMAASMGAVLLSCGAKGKRLVLPHSRVMIHQVSSGMSGVSKDLEIELEQTLRCKKDLYNILSEKTGKTYEQIEKDCDRNFWLIGQEAVEYGIADKVLSKSQK